MMAEINIAINGKVATLVYRIGEKIVDQESWTFPSIGQTEAKEAARIIFDDAYDFLNACVHGDIEDEEVDEEVETGDDEPG